jgi:hypothetical protein
MHIAFRQTGEFIEDLAGHVELVHPRAQGLEKFRVSREPPDDSTVGLGRI